MRNMLLIILFLIALPLYCMESSCNENPKKAFKSLIKKSSKVNQSEKIEALTILVSLIYKTAYDRIASQFTGCAPLTSPGTEAPPQIVINAYTHVIADFTEKKKRNMKYTVPEIPFNEIQDLLEDELEALNRGYKQIFNALRQLKPPEEIKYPETLSLMHFLCKISLVLLQS